MITAVSGPPNNSGRCVVQSGAKRIDRESGEKKMGLYINPKGMKKWEWLFKHALMAREEAPAIHTHKSHGLHTVVVCWVYNGHFTAAGVMYSAEELARWSDPSDERLKLWFIVSVAAVEAELGLPDAEWLK